MFGYLLLTVLRRYFYMPGAGLTQRFPVASLQDEMLQFLAGDYGE